MCFPWIIFIWIWSANILINMKKIRNQDRGNYFLTPMYKPPPNLFRTPLDYIQKFFICLPKSRTAYVLNGNKKNSLQEHFTSLWLLYCVFKFTVTGLFGGFVYLLMHTWKKEGENGAVYTTRWRTVIVAKWRVDICSYLSGEILTCFWRGSHSPLGQSQPPSWVNGPIK